MKSIPYKVTTASGNQFDFQFELHPQTESAVNVSNLLSSVLDAVAREVKLLEPVGNGDVLQALAMALAVRVRMLDGNPAMLDRLAGELLDAALRSPAAPLAGNVPYEAPRDLH